MRRLAPILALLAAGQAVAQQAPHAGRYHSDFYSCGDDRTTIVAPGRIRTQAYGDCTLSDPAAIRGISARAYDMTCIATGGDGRPYSERIILHFDPEGGLLMLVESGIYSFGRCP
jgi:hypothetical protein